MKLGLTFIILLFFIPLTVLSAPDYLEQAFSIVLDNSPTLSGRQGILNLEKRKHIWTSKLSVSGGYADKSSDDYPAGTDTRGRLSFEIPLFDDGGKSKNVAEERINVANEIQQLKSKFLEGISTLVMLDRKIQAVEFNQNVAYEKLHYFKAAQEAGVFDAAGLWTHYEAATAKEQEAFLAQEQYRIELEQVSREYGNAQWTELQSLVNQYVKAGRSSGVEAQATPGTIPTTNETGDGSSIAQESGTTQEE